jgi:FkbH-like protein
MAVQKDKDTQTPQRHQVDQALQAELALALNMSEIRFLIEKNQPATAVSALRSLMQEKCLPDETAKTLRQLCIALLQCFQGTKKYTELLDFFQTNQEFLQNEPAAQFLAGVACQNLGKAGEAIGYLNKATDLAPTTPDAYLALGDLHAQDQPLKAANCYFKYHDRNPTPQGAKIFIKKISPLLQSNAKSLPCKQISIAFIGNFTLEPLRPYLEAECLKRCIQPSFFFGGYDQYIQEMSDPKSALYQFNPDLTFLFLDSQAFLPELFNNFFDIAPENRFPMASSKLGQVKALIDKFFSLSRSKLAFSNFPLPRDYLLGVYDSHSPWGQKEVLLKMNEALQQFAAGMPQQLFVVDTDKALSNSGKSVVANEKIRYLAKMVIPEKAMPELARELMRHIRPALGMTKKCLVLDLDNTLWGGVLGEDGIEGIRLGLEPPGNAFYEFQKTIKTLQYRGVLLAINSKNDLDLVREAFEKHPYMQLKIEDFACIRANWQDKAQNMREIARELNLGLDSFVYMDDNPAERFLVQSELPEVMTVEMPEDFSEFTRTLMQLDAFEILHLTEEDKQRKYLYQTESKRNELKGQFTDINEYLKALEIVVDICPADTFSIPRIAQLTQRTNQFNLTTRRYTETDIKRFSQSAAHRVYFLKTHDRFGDHGITGVCIIAIKSLECEIDSFMLSCRIIGRGIEQAFMHHICNEARQLKTAKLVGRYLPTKKNQLAAKFLPEIHFDTVSKDDKETLFAMNLDKTMVPLPPHIQMNAR